MNNAFKLNSNLPPLSLPLKGGEGINCGHSYPKGAEEMNCEYLSPKGGETTSSISLPLSGGETTPSINLSLSGGEQKRGVFKYNSKSAFTLIELAIVVVVLGILVGGVLTGQSIIGSSKISSVITDIQKYKTAIRAFELEYDGLPGDFDEAEDYWGSVSGSCLTVAGSGTETCNGDGDKTFDYHLSGFSNSTHEPWRAWEHLSFAGIVNGEFTGISGTECNLNNYCSLPGVNIPESAFSGAGWNLLFLQSIQDFAGKRKSRNVMFLGNPSNDLYGHNRFFGPALTTKQQKRIDDKIDDGKPFLGSITELSGTEPSYTRHCTDINSNDHSTPNAVYDLEYDEPACVLIVDID
jgi:prepilin-type N-terminal cleavage/methylation domain-containing protein